MLIEFVLEFRMDSSIVLYVQEAILKSLFLSFEIGILNDYSGSFLRTSIY